MAKILPLTLKRKWFDMTRSGEKKEEYREIKPYWIRRLMALSDRHSESIIMDELVYDLRHPFERFHSVGDLLDLCGISFMRFDITHFTNGYGKHMPNFQIECKGIRIGIGNPEWGAPEYPVFIIEHGNIIN